MSAFLVLVAALDFANGPSSRALAVTGLAVGVALALTVLLDALWPAEPQS